MYGRLIKKHPVAINCLTAMGLFSSGDAIAQLGIEHKSEWDMSRTAKAATYGIIWAPIGDRWYKILGRIGGGKSGIVPTLKKVAIDQLVFAPTVGIPLYFTAMGVLNGKLVSEIQLQLKTKWRDTLYSNWMIWPWTQMANFYIVPVHYQLGASSVVGLGWNSYLSWKNYQSISKKG
ncbi:Protein required for ethanol metabolism [Scheffersomyces spartinae]|uniref:Protein SYM1 n=1 Tax=Scheffersomyces spartinae TaxID=45513 RepID=A0A9P7V7F9_9ASCO|nr:Protein required for ethanol metabolism [Scheffersomyces spartinae]KAG7192664.1 Protein required for ethanol metabolism [Scheffersomyces spartinae]